MAIASSACATSQLAGTPRITQADGASARATLHVRANAPRPELAPRALQTLARTAPEPSSAAIERHRCELSSGPETLGFYPTDAWPAGQVVLTFDDGPHPGKTPKVLDLLAKHRMPATFFVVGRAINKKTYPLVQRMVAEGHTIGSHSYNHDVDMAERQLSERARAYVRGQHEVTQILIELALLAKSEDDFSSMYQRVFDKTGDVWLSSTSLRADWPRFAERHAALLAERGYSVDARPYRVIHSRPPGGGPYLLGGTRPQRDFYATAMRELGLLNVMWHGESGDAHPQKKNDFQFLTANLQHYSKRGGILLIHDYIRTDALSLALERMAKDPSIQVVPIEQAVEHKYRCPSTALPLTARFQKKN